MSFYPGIPSSGQSLGNSRPQVLSNFSSLRDTLAVNHVDVNLIGAGKHKFVQMPAQGSAPITSADEIAEYVKVVSGNARVFVRQPNSGTEIQVSGYDPVLSNTAGSTYLPGGILLQWGSLANAGSGQVVTFPIAFTTVFQAYAIPSAIRQFGVSAVSNNTFTFVIENPSGAITVRWWAIGLKT